MKKERALGKIDERQKWKFSRVGLNLELLSDARETSCFLLVEIIIFEVGDGSFFWGIKIKCIVCFEGLVRQTQKKEKKM